MKKKNPYPLVIAVMIIFTLFTSFAHAQKPESTERELFYTYIGPLFSAGFNHLYQSDWFSDKNRQGDYNYRGSFVSGGFVICIFLKNFTGDFSMQYMHNFNEPGELYHLFYSISGKWVFKVSKPFHITTGLGLYFETPPSNEDYGGAAGGQILAGGIFNTTFNTKLFFDFFARYGFFGLGEYSSKVSYGINLGFIFKVGRI